MSSAPAAVPSADAECPGAARAAAWGVVAVAGTALLAATLGDEAVARQARLLIRPDAAAVGLTCALGLLARLRRPRAAASAPSRLAAAVALAVALGDLGCLAPYGLGGSAPCAALPRLGARMAPSAAVLFGLAAMSLWAQAAAAPGGRRLGRATSALGLATSAFFACAYALGEAVPGPSSPTATLLPLGSVVGLLLHGGLYVATTSGEALQHLRGGAPGARLARRLLFLGAPGILLLGVLRVQLQRAGVISLAQGTAAMVLVLLATLAASSWDAAQQLSRTTAAQAAAIAELHALGRQRDAVVVAHAEARARLASVLEAATDYAIIATDAAGLITVFSEGAVRLLGFDAAEMVGRHTPETFHDAQELQACAHQLDTPATMQVFPALLGHHGSDTREWTYITRAGRRLPVSLSVAGVRDADGALRGIVGVARDITAEKQRAAEAARQAEFEQQLIGIVSHDLRNPLNVILLTASALLRQAHLPPRVRRMLTRVERAGARSERMLHDLLDLTRARQGGLQISERPADIDAIVAEVVREARLLHPERRLELPAAAWPHGLLRIDPDRIAQALGNLLSNALEHSPPDTPVRVSLAATADGVTLSVHNAGPPIDAALMPQLFRPLPRGAGHRDGRSRSIGLGLYIVEQIARAHGGRVGVRSTAADGTHFELALPHARRSAADGRRARA